MNCSRFGTNDRQVPRWRHRSGIVTTVGALLALGSAGLHLLSAVGGHFDPAVGSLVVIMALMCMSCALQLIRNPDPKTWAAVGLSATAMLALHALAAPHSNPHTHHALADGGVQVQSIPPMMATATAMALLEVVVAVAALFWRTQEPPAAVVPYPSHS
jgi:hypothetical protein